MRRGARSRLSFNWRPVLACFPPNLIVMRTWNHGLTSITLDSHPVLTARYEDVQEEDSNVFDLDLRAELNL